MIRIGDNNIYKLLTEDAKKNKRSRQKQLEIILEDYYSIPVYAKGLSDKAIALQPEVAKRLKKAPVEKPFKVKPGEIQELPVTKLPTPKNETQVAWKFCKHGKRVDLCRFAQPGSPCK